MKSLAGKYLSMKREQLQYDWQKAKRRLRKCPMSKKAEWVVIDCERFFLSEYFYGLTGVSGEEFLKKLEAQEEKRYAK